MARVIAPRGLTALGVGRGEVMRVARSLRSRGPRRGSRAPRRSAASASSSTSAPAPSPITKPSRRASNGREMPLVGGRGHRGEGGDRDRRQRRLGAAADDRVGVTGADHPHRRPDRVGAGRAGRDDAVGLPVQAVAHRDRGGGRVAHHQRHRAAARPRSAPRSRSTPTCSSSEPRPPIPVPTTQPVRSGSGTPSAQPACASASSAATTASWVKRSGAARLLAAQVLGRLELRRSARRRRRCRTRPRSSGRAGRPRRPRAGSRRRRR